MIQLLMLWAGSAVPQFSEWLYFLVHQKQNPGTQNSNQNFQPLLYISASWQIPWKIQAVLQIKCAFPKVGN